MGWDGSFSLGLEWDRNIFLFLSWDWRTGAFLVGVGRERSENHHCYPLNTHNPLQSPFKKHFFCDIWLYSSHRGIQFGALSVPVFRVLFRCSFSQSVSQCATQRFPISQACPRLVRSANWDFFPPSLDSSAQAFLSDPISPERLKKQHVSSFFCLILLVPSWFSAVSFYQSSKPQSCHMTVAFKRSFSHVINQRQLLLPGCRSRRRRVKQAHTNLGNRAHIFECMKENGLQFWNVVERWWNWCGETWLAGLRHGDCSLVILRETNNFISIDTLTHTHTHTHTLHSLTHVQTQIHTWSM